MIWVVAIWFISGFLFAVFQVMESKRANGKNLVPVKYLIGTVLFGIVPFIMGFCEVIKLLRLARKGGRL